MKIIAKCLALLYLSYKIHVIVCNPIPLMFLILWFYLLTLQPVLCCLAVLTSLPVHRANHISYSVI